MSLCRQNYHEECEAGINKQINLELYASYVYLSMAYHFDRDDVALPGFHKFMLKQSDEEREHARKLMKYQNERGGRIVLQDVKKPDKEDWGCGLEACQAALDLEKHVNQALLDLHKIADSNGDPQLQGFLESEFLEGQVESIKELSNFFNTLTRLSKDNYALGEYQFDKVTLKGNSKE
ncbi:unnamed protein product [Porites evermanni]|uniref:Ferritin n=1 Tax=Porites evermanni TaxID=104178 RepID=A0ABN8R742_9CNID|nr:unnamed protein product [Porites evermanni]